MEEVGQFPINSSLAVAAFNGDATRLIAARVDQGGGETLLFVKEDNSFDEESRFATNASDEFSYTAVNFFGDVALLGNMKRLSRVQSLLTGDEWKLVSLRF